ncbi:RpiB/LacA/LacB family sugar-phosphate isomerase [Candidatus Microgenomates bacterium]|nr:RpiB/LacA/LacB family sugar-phosphate isomerase [Candidatus Microgenomates bacterium]
MRIFLSSDHAGFELKNSLREHLVHHGLKKVEDLGPSTLNPNDDYPQFTYRLTTKLLGSTDKDPRGIMVCGSGQGMCIAANRVRGIRAALVWNEEVAKDSRQDNDSNVLCLPARFLDTETAYRIADTWLKEPFSGAARHKRRLDEIEELYG